MSNLADNDLAAANAPSRIKQHVNQRVAALVVAASKAAGTLPCLNHAQKMVLQAGTIMDMFFILGVICGGGESMVADVQKSVDGGATWATILTGTLTIDSTHHQTARVIDAGLMALLDPAKTTVAVGNMLCVVLTYTAGATPTPLANLEFMIEIE